MKTGIEQKQTKGTKGKICQPRSHPARGTATEWNGSGLEAGEFHG